MKKHGHVVVKELATGEVYSGIIDCEDDFECIDKYGYFKMLIMPEYEIITDLRCEYYIGQELEFSSDGKAWQKRKLCSYNPNNNFPYLADNSVFYKEEGVRPIQEERESHPDNLQYLMGFADGYGGNEPHEVFPKGFNNINEVWDRISELKEKG